MVKSGSALEQAMEELKNLSGDPDFNEIVQARAKQIMDDVSFRNAAKREAKREGIREGIREGEKRGKALGMKERSKTAEKRNGLKLRRKKCKD